MSTDAAYLANHVNISLIRYKHTSALGAFALNDLGIYVIVLKHYS